MTSDHQITPGLIADVLDALKRHGYARGDDRHADRATGLIGDLARVREGTQDHPAGAHPITVPSSQPAQPGPGGQAAPDGVVLAGRDISTVMVALDLAAGYQRDRAERCADCLGRSCAACQTRLRDAWAYDGMAGRLAWAAQAAQAATARSSWRPSRDPRKCGHQRRTRRQRRCQVASPAARPSLGPRPAHPRRCLRPAEGEEKLAL
jgi:hypothetical protein